MLPNTINLERVPLKSRFKQCDGNFVEAKGGPWQVQMFRKKFRERNICKIL